MFILYQPSKKRSICFGGAVASSYSKMYQTHAGYFMAADRRIAIADRLKHVPMGFFNANSTGQLSGVCTTVVSSIESMVPMVLVNILGGLIITAVFALVILVFDWRIGLITLAGILIYLCIVSAMEKKTAAIAGDTQRSQTDLVEAVLEAVQGMSVVKSFNLTGKGDKKLQAALERNRVSNLNVECVMTPYTAAQEAVLQIAGGGMMLAAVALWIGGSTTLPKALMVLVMSFLAFSQISMVFRDVYLFADTIENNIKFGCQNASHEQVVEAARRACCDDFIEALPDGYKTVIGEGGASLSGGEKQRISIARALLKDVPIIILDEATANVDPENEDRLQKEIEALTHEKAVLMIAHRLKTVRNADQILVLDGGAIVQRGTHAELAAREGVYRDFIAGRQQAAGWKM